MNDGRGAKQPPLRAGDWVEVRSKEEILKTLDKDGQIDGMPFMPEMFQYCGKRLQVVKSAHKTCDTISGAWEGRRLTDSVHLDSIRCDGKAHGGCEAACLLFWKDAWLKPADTASRPAAPLAEAPPMAGACSEERVMAATRAPASTDGQPVRYVCQATELLRASTPLPWWDLRQYVDDYRSGNATLRRMAQGAVYSASANLVRALKNRPRIQSAVIKTYDSAQAIRGGVQFPRKHGAIPSGQKTPAVALNLQPGELVRVKSYEEILTTLDEDNENRGMTFDAEQVPFCGGTYRVRSRVNRIVNEKNGRMVELKTPAILLEGVTCQACYSSKRMFCPRAVFPYWREIWLERATQA